MKFTKSRQFLLLSKPNTQGAHIKLFNLGRTFSLEPFISIAILSSSGVWQSLNILTYPLSYFQVINIYTGK